MKEHMSFTFFYCTEEWFDSFLHWHTQGWLSWYTIGLEFQVVNKVIKLRWRNSSASYGLCKSSCIIDDSTCRSSTKRRKKSWRIRSGANKLHKAAACLDPSEIPPTSPLSTLTASQKRFPAYVSPDTSKCSSIIFYHNNYETQIESLRKSFMWKNVFQ